MQASFLKLNKKYYSINITIKCSNRQHLGSVYESSEVAQDQLRKRINKCKKDIKKSEHDAKHAERVIDANMVDENGYSFTTTYTDDGCFDYRSYAPMSYVSLYDYSLKTLQKHLIILESLTVVNETIHPRLDKSVIRKLKWRLFNIKSKGCFRCGITTPGVEYIHYRKHEDSRLCIFCVAALGEAAQEKISKLPENVVNDYHSKHFIENL